MDPFYFTTDLDYAFGASSGFNPDVYNGIAKQMADNRKAAAGVNTNDNRSKATTKPNKGKPAKKSAPKRANYDGMTFNQAFATARRDGKLTFNWRGKQYTTEIAPMEPTPTEPFAIEQDLSVDNTPLEIEPGTDRSWRQWNPGTAAASYGAEAGLRRATLPPQMDSALQYADGGYLGPINILGDGDFLRGYRWTPYNPQYHGEGLKDQDGRVLQPGDPIRTDLDGNRVKWGSQGHLDYLAEFGEDAANARVQSALGPVIVQGPHVNPNKPMSRLLPSDLLSRVEVPANLHVTYEQQLPHQEIYDSTDAELARREADRQVQQRLSMPTLYDLASYNGNVRQARTDPGMSALMMHSIENGFNGYNSSIMDYVDPFTKSKQDLAYKYYLENYADEELERIIQEDRDEYGRFWNGGTPQYTYFLDPQQQQQAFLRDGYIPGRPGDYGVVNQAATEYANKYHKDIPVWQTAPDALGPDNMPITRDQLIPIGNGDNRWDGEGTAPTHPGNFRSSYYIDPRTGRIITKTWDFNDYGGSGGSTAQEFLGSISPGSMLDAIGNPVVETTGFQNVWNYKVPEIVNGLISPQNSTYIGVPDARELIEKYNPGLLR